MLLLFFFFQLFGKVCGVNGNGQCPPDIKEVPDVCGVCGGDNSGCLASGNLHNLITSFLLSLRSLILCLSPLPPILMCFFKYHFRMAEEI
jgi:hypothetical protein